MPAANRLKIAWLTPLVRTSAIARYSSLVLPELRRIHDVEAWTFDPGAVMDPGVPLRKFQHHAQASAALDYMDIAMYQIGNNWPFHGQIMLTAQSKPGIVVAHDYTLQHLIAAYCFEVLRSADEYVRIVRESHGDVGAEQAAAAIAGRRPPIWETEDALEYTLMPVVTNGALGVLTHSQFALGGLRRHYDGPTLVLPLAYRSPLTQGDIPGRADLRLAGDDLLVITTGHMNANKRPREVIRALATLPPHLRKRVVYALLGPIEPDFADELMNQAIRAGIADRVRIEGFTEDTRLHAYIAQADVCVNLRYPNYEAASATLIEQLLAGKAVVVSNTGWFAELPGDVVQHLESDDMLSGVLEKVLADEYFRRRLGARAAEYAACTFGPSAYAFACSAFAADVIRQAPVRQIEIAIDSAARGMGLPGNSAWTDSVRKRVRKLFVAPDRNG